MAEVFADVNKIALYAVGLMNGSLGFALKRAGFRGEIVGVGRRAETLEAAKACGAIDDFAVESDAADILANAKIVVSGTLPHLIADSLIRLERHLPEGAILTDVGSVKAEIARECDLKLQGGRFVGGHPIAGSHRTGVEAARADLFDGRVCVLTPTESTDESATAVVREMWGTVGMNVIELPPEAHDRLLAASSHLPHVAASMLAAVVSATEDGGRRAVDFAGSGYRDTTRIAQGSADLWEPILRMNAGPVEALTRQYAAELIAFADALAAGDSEDVRRRLHESRESRADDA